MKRAETRFVSFKLKIEYASAQEATAISQPDKVFSRVGVWRNSGVSFHTESLWRHMTLHDTVETGMWYVFYITFPLVC